MEKLNTQNNPRSNLLASLKPYLREEKKRKIRSILKSNEFS